MDKKIAIIGLNGIGRVEAIKLLKEECKSVVISPIDFEKLSDWVEPYKGEEITTKKYKEGKVNSFVFKPKEYKDYPTKGSKYHK
ncbi:hypothetical protein AXE80_10780 [Wenyingzhuangia fucanilytica]|uniref:Uncharacterized protein n=1 Tax=Wenyingzhuangia fucanilytica TaxID=1790137 RepID=A0A1B1Y7L4_9FLAO|nr:hypothetical protein [Wenyingzhuangia fucanilytica]ANW96728.1 hypothetical protein AXE80_10780 [Wenyingzhuangia fucanilytica]